MKPVYFNAKNNIQFISGLLYGADQYVRRAFLTDSNSHLIHDADGKLKWVNERPDNLEDFHVVKHSSELRSYIKDYKAWQEAVSMPDTYQRLFAALKAGAKITMSRRNVTEVVSAILKLTDFTFIVLVNKRPPLIVNTHNTTGIHFRFNDKSWDNYLYDSVLSFNNAELTSDLPRIEDKLEKLNNQKEEIQKQLQYLEEEKLRIKRKNKPSREVTIYTYID